MKINKWCNSNINSCPLSIDAVLSELQELTQVKSYEEFKEELSDCLYSIFCVIATYTGITLSMIGCTITLDKADKRFKKWKEIFK